jgi:hypothetical protein
MRLLVLMLRRLLSLLMLLTIAIIVDVFVADSDPWFDLYPPCLLLLLLALVYLRLRIEEDGDEQPVCSHDVFIVLFSVILLVIIVVVNDERRREATTLMPMALSSAGTAYAAGSMGMLVLS